MELIIYFHVCYFFVFVFVFFKAFVDHNIGLLEYYIKLLPAPAVTPPRKEQ